MGEAKIFKEFLEGEMIIFKSINELNWMRCKATCYTWVNLRKSLLFVDKCVP